MSERDPEMIERAKRTVDAWLRERPEGRTAVDVLHDFARAEVRRALVEELGRLRVSTCSRIVEETAVDRGVNVHVEHVTRIIDARLRELREDGSYYATAGVTGTGSELLKVRGETEQQPVVKAGQPMHVGTDRSMLAHFTAPRPGSSPRASDTAQTTAKDAGSIPLPGATLRERAERLLVCIPEPTFRKWAVDNAVALANDEADRAAQEMEAKMDEELHAVRMEAQTLREANEAWSFANGKLIGWIKWRQAWTGGNDPRDLSGTRWDICALRGDAPPRGFEARPGSSPTTETPVVKAGQTMHVGTDRSLLVHFAQTAAKDAGSTPAPGTLCQMCGEVCGEQSEVAAGSRAPERVENAQADLPAPASSPYYAMRDQHGYATAICHDGFAIVNLNPGAWINERNGGVDAILAALNKPEPPAPAISDADVLERAADVLDKSTSGLSGVVRKVAAKLRAAPPAPSADWIERMVEEWRDQAYDDQAAFLRARLSPVEEKLELIVKNGDAYARADAKRALSIMRGEVTP